jgi:hypothetical protein
MMLRIPHKEKFDFLGFSIWRGESKKTGNMYSHVQPSKKSLQTIKDRVTELTKRTRTVKPLGKIGAPVIFASVAARSTGSTGCIKCQQQQGGRKRMPHGEEHRKAVCGKTACTV